MPPLRGSRVCGGAVPGLTARANFYHPSGADVQARSESTCPEQPNGDLGCPHGVPRDRHAFPFHLPAQDGERRRQDSDRPLFPATILPSFPSILASPVTILASFPSILASRASVLAIAAGSGLSSPLRQPPQQLRRRVETQAHPRNAPADSSPPPELDGAGEGQQHVRSAGTGTSRQLGYSALSISPSGTRAWKRRPSRTRSASSPSTTGRAPIAR